MSDRAKEIVIKTTIVVGCVFGLLILFIPIIAAILDGKYYEVGNIHQAPLPQPFYTIWVIDLIAFFVSGTILMILLPIFGLKQKPVKAEKITLLFDDFNLLANHIQDSAVKNNYKQQSTQSFATDSILITFVRPNGLWKLDCIALVRTYELTDDILDMANNKITESLKAYYGTKRITDTVSMISIICVDRITPAFQKLVNGNIQQGFKNLRLPVGISFGGKSIYIAKQKDGFAISKYKKLRKEFLKLLPLTIEDK